MRTIERSKQFKKDLKRELRGKHSKNIQDEVCAVLEHLVQDIPLELKYKDHMLSGDWSGYRECHIKPDLLLIYKTTDDTLRLARLGSHSELF